MIHLLKILIPLSKQKHQLYKGIHCLNVLVLGALFTFDLIHTRQQHSVVDSHNTSSVIQQLIQNEATTFSLKNLENYIVQILPNSDYYTHTTIRNYFAITNTPTPLNLEDTQIAAPLHDGVQSFHFTQITPGHNPPPSPNMPMTALVEQKKSHQVVGNVISELIDVILDHAGQASHKNNETPPEESVLKAITDDAQENVVMFSENLPLQLLLLDPIGIRQHPVEEALPPPTKAKTTVDPLPKFGPYQKDEIFDVSKRYMNYACDKGVCESFFGFSEENLHLIKYVSLKFNHTNENDQRALRDFQAGDFLDSLKRMPNLERLEIHEQNLFESKDLRDFAQVLQTSPNLQVLFINNGGVTAALPAAQLNGGQDIIDFALNDLNHFSQEIQQNNLTNKEYAMRRQIEKEDKEIRMQILKIEETSRQQILLEQHQTQQNETGMNQQLINPFPPLPLKNDNDALPDQ